MEDEIEITPCEQYLIGDDDVEDQRMTLGEHRGYKYSEILAQFPEYANKLQLAYKGKKFPKYVEGYLTWHQHTTKIKPLPTRARVHPEPVVLDKACDGGCKSIAARGSNQHIKKYMCLDCGFGKTQKVDLKPE